METMNHQQSMMKIMAEAVQFCCEKEYLAEELLFRALQAGQENVHSRLRYALAKGISGYLGGLDDNLESVYVYGSTMDDKAGFGSDIDLIVKVKSKKGRTQRALEVLDSHLLISYQYLMGDDEFRMNCMLDVHIIDEDDIKQRNSYASILSSRYIAPVKVWSRV